MAWTRDQMAERAAMKSQSQRRLYGSAKKSGLVIDDDEPADMNRMTDTTKRRLYG